MNRRKAGWIALGGLGAIASLELARVVFRDAHLFEPSREPVTTWDPSSYGLDPDFVDVLSFESGDGTMLTGWYCRAKNPVASALYCHGHRGNITTSGHFLKRITDAGVNVFVFDYRGFGRSEGRPTLGGVLGDAFAAAAEHDRLRPRDIPSILWGYSLGGAIAIQTARRVPFHALIVQSSFTSLSDIARVKFEKVPLHLLSWRELDSASAIESIKLPLLVIHGSKDEIVPNRMGQRLFDGASSERKTFIMIAGGQHRDLWDVDPKTMIESVRRLVAELGATEELEPSRGKEPLLDSFARWTRRRLRKKAEGVAL